MRKDIRKGTRLAFSRAALTDCRRRSTSQTVYSLCSNVTVWHGVDSARTETSEMRKTKRARPSFEKFSTTILFDLLDWLVSGLQWACHSRYRMSLSRVKRTARKAAVIG